MDARSDTGSRDRTDARGAEVFTITPFVRLARAHGLSVAGDGLLAIALADSLFFNVDPNDARWKVAAYLLLTIAPFAVVAPFLGPLMDRVRGGHRSMVVGAAVVRALVMFALVRYVQGPLLFPLAFSMLVMGKTHAIAKSALVPTTVADTEGLVRANSRLSVIGGVATATAGVPGVILLRLGGSPWVLVLGGILFVAAALFAMRIPATQVAAAPAEAEEKAELRSAGIILAASAMGYLRGVAGFITLLLAFTLRGGIDPGPTATGVEVGHRVREAMGLDRLDLTSGGAPAWHFGVVLIGVGLGGLVGALGVPRLRLRFPEERILALALFALAACAALASVSTGVGGAFIVGFALAVAGTGGKQSFDAIVQRDAPKANLGRSFSRFESRFQLFWVVGALIPVVTQLPARLGYVLVTVTALFVGLSYWFGRHPDPRGLLADQQLTAGVRHRMRESVGEGAAIGRRFRRSAGSSKTSAPDAPPPTGADSAPPVDPRGRRGR